jgi:hypothetical protein
MKIDYGLKVLPDTILRIANVKEYQWLLQPELKAIKDGLKYVEDKDCVYNSFNNEMGKYRGYLNAQDQRQGVGIVSCGDRKVIGEWHEDDLHGLRKIEWKNFYNNWGQYKYGKEEGYSTHEYHDGRVMYYQCKIGC